MLEFAAIVPHSPLLSSRISNKQIIPAKADKVFAEFAKTIQEKGIKHIVSIGSHPRFERTTFSCYISDTYTIKFAEFGDLVTQAQVKVWLQGFHQLREESRKAPLELLSQGNIDYTHGIPLIQIASQFDPTYPLDFLAINTATQMSENDQEAFGEQVRDALNALDEPYAVLCSGDLYTTTDQAQSKFIHAENKKIKQQIEESLNFRQSSSLNDVQTVKSPTLSSTLPVLKGIIGDKQLVVEEKLYESIIQTSFYFAQVNL